MALLLFHGNIEHINLPHSGLNCGISTRYFPRPDASRGGDHGVLPDLPLDTRLSDEKIVETVMQYIADSPSSHKERGL